MATLTIAPNRRLARNAALSYERMRAEGMPAGGINSALRTRAEQEGLFYANYQRGTAGARTPLDRRVYKGIAYYRRRGGVAVAIPGSIQSNHESGLALDISSSSNAHAWMVRNAGRHGWVRNVPGEPWHFEYRQHLDQHYGESAGRFRDVLSGHKFAREIQWLADKGITNGFSDRTFRPGDNVTREAMAAFLYRLAGRPAVSLPARSPFRDVKPSDQFYREIVWLAQQRITTGYADGTFRPRDHITRDAMAAFLYRAAGRPAFTTPARASFKDITRSQFRREIEWLRSQRITTGYADGTYRPHAPITREATAAFLYRFAN